MLLFCFYPLWCIPACQIPKHMRGGNYQDSAQSTASQNLHLNFGLSPVSRGDKDDR
ncbi:hypothetical protein NCCP2222_29610 [Sporosarcina sp. NCCP-2222]|nr:hypothetical protein NCCP2222_29610 [Sporosarcina sp. NCCP-2222]